MTQPAPVDESPSGIPVAPGNRTRMARNVLRQPTALFGLVVIALLFFLAAFGPAITPHDPNDQDIPRRFEGPSADYLLGTDHLGRDILSRLIAGTRLAIVIAIPTITLAVTAGIVIGLAAGYLGGKADAALLFFLDFLSSFPGLILALVLIALLGPSIPNLILVITLSLIPVYGRVTRASVLGVKENQFVLAERSLGASPMRISFSHVLPNVIGPILIVAAMDIPIAIVAESGLSFLGLGVPPPNPSWGSMLAEGFTRVRDAPLPVVWPSLAIALTMIAFTLVGEAVRNVADPKGAGLGQARRVS